MRRGARQTEAEPTAADLVEALRALGTPQRVLEAAAAANLDRFRPRTRRRLTAVVERGRTAPDAVAAEDSVEVPTGTARAETAPPVVAAEGLAVVGTLVPRAAVRPQLDGALEVEALRVLVEEVASAGSDSGSQARAGDWQLVVGPLAIGSEGVDPRLVGAGGTGATFVSVSIARPAMLRADQVAALRAHGPVGCRDWATVDALLERGVDAFLAGPTGVLLGALTRPVGRGAGAGVMHLGVPGKGNARRVAWRVDPAVPPVELPALAAQRLVEVARDGGVVLTASLNAYAALVAGGRDAELVRRGRMDQELEGLTVSRFHEPARRLELDVDGLAAGFREAVTSVVGALRSASVGEAGDDAVRAAWAAAVGDRVVACRAVAREPERART